MNTSPFKALLIGFVIWSLAFLLLYAAQATGCKLGWHQMVIGPASVLRLVLGGMLLAILAVLLAIGWVWLRPVVTDKAQADQKTLLRIAGVVHVAAVLATAVTFAGVWWLSLC